MSEESCDFLGRLIVAEDDSNDNHFLESRFKLVEYRPKNYKNWGKNPVFTKRVIRQKSLPDGTIEIVFSYFIENP